MADVLGVHHDHQRANKDQPLLDVRGLKTHFFTDDGVVKAVDGVDLVVHEGEIFGLVGESASGKTITALSILRLLPPPGRTIAGEILFDGASLLEFTEREMSRLRGSRISMIFQEPLASLNPVFSIGAQVAETFRAHQELERDDAWLRAVELLAQVGIADASESARAYPHQISGGQAQRVMIATALALNPMLLIADEPTSALDVTIQAQILDLIHGLTRSRKTAVILITHDLGVVAEMCHRVAVMYAGQIVEEAPVLPLFDTPLHPYTKGLLAAIPKPGEGDERLKLIEGDAPDAMHPPEGCRFAERCDARITYDLRICTALSPSLLRARSNHSVRCWLYQDHHDHAAPLRIRDGGERNINSSEVIDQHVE
jgi:oligopeptide/dipeptide ABC transporter ATP-binding protein